MMLDMLLYIIGETTYDLNDKFSDLKEIAFPSSIINSTNVGGLDRCGHVVI